MKNGNPVPFELTGMGARIGEVADMYESRKSAAFAAGVSVASLQRYISEDTDQPPFPALAKLCLGVGARLEWVATGEGTILPAETGMTAAAQAKDFAVVSMYDVAVSTGHGTALADEQVISALAFRRDWLRQEGLSATSLAAIRAEGDSMEPTIPNGETLLIDTSQRSITGNAVYALRLGDHRYAKRLQRLIDGSIRVSSDNSAYREELIQPDQVDQLAVIGKVVWHGGRM